MESLRDIVSLSVRNLNLEAFQKWLSWEIDPQLPGLLPVRGGLASQHHPPRVGPTTQGPSPSSGHPVRVWVYPLSLRCAQRSVQSLGLSQWLVTLPLHTSRGWHLLSG